ncbi:helix-turn-helix domain-containing protein, partial [Lactococcus piscium]|uniref:helix-turn-helix domain-containing protein n=1 Tax=Pseudolactococcus piscium TaxID=1364 RepID=UPI0011798A14
MENLTAARLKELRKQKGATMEKMAFETGIKKPTISNYENGYSKPKDNNLKKLANYYSVSPSYLLGYIDTPKEELMTFNSGEEFDKTR